MTAMFVWLAFNAGCRTPILVGEQEVVDLFGDLPVSFVIESREAGEQGRVFRLRSVEPIDQTASGAIYLRATLTISSPGPESAEKEVARLLEVADPDLGLSYAWDYVAADAGSLVHLSAACTFSEESFQKVTLALARKLTTSGAVPPVSFWCRCGSGCRSGSPTQHRFRP